MLDSDLHVVVTRDCSWPVALLLACCSGHSIALLCSSVELFHKVAAVWMHLLDATDGP